MHVSQALSISVDKIVFFSQFYRSTTSWMSRWRKSSTTLHWRPWSSLNTPSSLPWRGTSSPTCSQMRFRSYANPSRTHQRQNWQWVVVYMLPTSCLYPPLHVVVQWSTQHNDYCTLYLFAVAWCIIGFFDQRKGWGCWDRRGGYAPGSETQHTRTLSGRECSTSTRCGDWPRGVCLWSGGLLSCLPLPTHLFCPGMHCRMTLDWVYVYTMYLYMCIISVSYTHLTLPTNREV